MLRFAHRSSSILSFVKYNLLFRNRFGSLRQVFFVNALQREADKQHVASRQKQHNTQGAGVIQNRQNHGSCQKQRHKCGSGEIYQAQHQAVFLDISQRIPEFGNGGENVMQPGGTEEQRKQVHQVNVWQQLLGWIPGLNG